MVALKRIVDTILLFCFCFLTGTGLMMKFSFVKGLGPQTVLNLSKHDWEILHLYVGLLMLAAVVFTFSPLMQLLIIEGANRVEPSPSPKTPNGLTVIKFTFCIFA